MEENMRNQLNNLFNKVWAAHTITDLRLQSCQINWQFLKNSETKRLKYGDISSPTLHKISNHYKGMYDPQDLATKIIQLLQIELPLYPNLEQNITKIDSVNGFINISFKNLAEIYKKEEEKENIEQINEFEIQINNNTNYIFQPIGEIRSIFKECFGTPRQFSIAPTARGYITLKNIESAYLEGLEEYSYIWLIWVFHQNLTKFNRNMSKITPPKAQGEKYGIFATRSPHRYNPIGLSIAKIEQINNNTLHLSGIDLVDGTPILDIKPYIYTDSIPETQMPEWVRRKPIQDEGIAVNFRIYIESQIEELIRENKLEFYGEAGEVMTLIREVLEANPQSLHTLNKHNSGGVYALALDNMEIIYTMDNTKSVFTVVYVRELQVGGVQRLRTAQWFEEVKLLLNIYK